MFCTSLKGHIKNIFRKKGDELETAIKKEILAREKNGAIDSKTSSAKTLMDSDPQPGKNDNNGPHGEY